MVPFPDSVGKWSGKLRWQKLSGISSCLQMFDLRL